MATTRGTRTWERLVFLVHGIVTLAAAAMLAAFPTAIPATVGIVMRPSDFLLSYFLSAAELGIAVLSIGAARLSDSAAIRLIAAGFAVFHLATAALEVVYLVVEGVDAVLIVNIAVRLVAFVVFVLVWRSRRS